MIMRIFLYIIISGSIYFASQKWLYNFRYDDLKDYINLLSGVSGMVFTIMGIWIAFLYPNAMSRILDPDKIIAKDFSESQSDAKRLESIVGAVMCSGLVMIIILFFSLIKTIIYTLPVYSSYRIEIKSTALAIIFCATLIQLESVIKVVLSNILFINDLHFKQQAKKADNEL